MPIGVIVFSSIFAFIVIIILINEYIKQYKKDTIARALRKDERIKRAQEELEENKRRLDAITSSKITHEFENSRARGNVYFVINHSMPGLIKIGMTTRYDVEERIKELNKTGTPTPFQLIGEIHTNDVRHLEKSLHELCADYRVSKDREFFRMSISRLQYMLFEEGLEVRLLPQECYVVELNTKVNIVS